MNDRINTEKPAAAFHLPRWNELPDIGLYMDQVITLINKYIERLSPCGDGTLTPSMINNYVKLGIIPCPVKKKYSRVQLSRLIMICVMKPVLPIQSIGSLIDTLLLTRTEEQLLDFFSERYEQTFLRINDMLRTTMSDVSQSETDGAAMLSLSAMHAAAISGGSKLLAENALVQLRRMTQPENEASDEKDKKSEKKSKEKKDKKDRSEQEE